MVGSIRSKLRASGHGMLGTATIAPWRLVEPMRGLRRCKGVPSPTLSAPTHADVCATNQSAPARPSRPRARVPRPKEKEKEFLLERSSRLPLPLETAQRQPCGPHERTNGKQAVREAHGHAPTAASAPPA